MTSLEYVTFPSLTRGRSDSIKRRHSNGTGDESEFKLPRDQVRKINKRQKLSNTAITASYSNKVEHGVPQKANTKPFNWGRSKDEDITGFSGRVPDAFISRCSLQTDGDGIKNHLIKKGIKVKNVERKSKEIAKTRSFKISVESHADYDKLISGDFIPKSVKVEKFIYYKTFKGNNRGQKASRKPAINSAELTSVIEKGLNELDHLANPAARLDSNGNTHLIDNILNAAGSVTKEVTV